MEGVEAHRQVRVPFARTWRRWGVSVALFLGLWVLEVPQRGPLGALLGTWSFVVVVPVGVVLSRRHRIGGLSWDGSTLVLTRGSGREIRLTGDELVARIRFSTWFGDTWEGVGVHQADSRYKEFYFASMTPEAAALLEVARPGLPVVEGVRGRKERRARVEALSAGHAAGVPPPAPPPTAVPSPGPAAQANAPFVPFGEVRRAPEPPPWARDDFVDDPDDD